MSRKSKVELTNMCLIYNENRILVQEKVGTKYEGGSCISWRSCGSRGIFERFCYS